MSLCTRQDPISGIPQSGPRALSPSFGLTKRQINGIFTAVIEIPDGIFTLMWIQVPISMICWKRWTATPQGYSGDERENSMSITEEFRNYLKDLPPGAISNENEQKVMSLLVNCWEDLSGSENTSLKYYKLPRAENLTFIPPHTLTFEIERHGAAVKGSVYGEVHKWTIDLLNCSAKCDRNYKRRVLSERARPLKVEPLVEEIVNQIINLYKTAENLKWSSDRKVKILIGNIIPATNKQTTVSRRKRFRDKLEASLAPHGWHPTSVYNTYEKID